MGVCSFSRRTRSRTCPAPAAAAVHRTALYSVLDHSVGIDKPGRYPQGEGLGGAHYTHAPPKHCAGLSNNKGSPHPHVLDYRPGANQSRKRRGEKEKQEGEEKLSDAFNKRVQGGQGRGLGPPGRPREAGRSTAQSQTVQPRLHSTCASHGQSPEPWRQRFERHTRQVEE